MSSAPSSSPDDSKLISLADDLSFTLDVRSKEYTYDFRSAECRDFLFKFLEQSLMKLHGSISTFPTHAAECITKAIRICNIADVTKIPPEHGSSSDSKCFEDYQDQAGTFYRDWVNARKAVRTLGKAHGLTSAHLASLGRPGESAKERS